MKPRVPMTMAQIEAGRSRKGGFTRAQLAKWGVAWPPRKGWQTALILGVNPNQPVPAESRKPPERARTESVLDESQKRVNDPSGWPEIGLARFYFQKPTMGIKQKRI